ncbi:hypothetical protein KTH44_22825 [Acinetobacter bereziniae]|uniref:hypothetical protein n=1 Tax=Acinetobacter bereziniae TaxID=106648 RepID=UPI0021CDE2E8|nr:hypothetical protein [Acinetobacter bereziniae]MCU4321909.1 hypothetical protein [Acinetobacter bereziniae]
MNKIYIFSILIMLCSNSYAEKIKVKILYNIPKKEIITILVNTTDPYKKIKCEEKTMSKESRELMYMATRNKRETTIMLTQICNL